jgi:hypothetical protein
MTAAIGCGLLQRDTFIPIVAPLCRCARHDDTGAFAEMKFERRAEAACGARQLSAHAAAQAR